MKNLIHRTKLSIRLQVTHCLQIVQKCNKKQTWLLQGQECMERVCKELRDHAVKIINYEEKEMIPLTDRENKSDGEQKVFTYATRNFVLIKMIKMSLNYTIKQEIIVIARVNLEELLIVFAIQDTKHQKKLP